MRPATPLPLRALLSMPTALRPVLLGALTFAPASSPARSPARSPSPSPSHWRLRRSFAASALRHAASRIPDVAVLRIPALHVPGRKPDIAAITAADLFGTSSPPSLSSLPSLPLCPSESELAQALDGLFTGNPAAFLYADSDFYKLKKNTRVPEVCILGRSNVGKSSFVNALANRPSNGLAHVSSKTGRTKSMNAYGFGPAPTMKELQDRGPQPKNEDIPTHAFHLVDMPGYGQGSLHNWGKNITLYLQKRTALKGAILLIDAQVGPKPSDFNMLQLLSRAQLTTSIIMTKADKVRKGLAGLRNTCTEIWEGIRRVEARSTMGDWAWERDVYVSAVGANDSAVAMSTLATARLAVARLAGLVKDEQPDRETNKRWSGKVVSFDNLQYAPVASDIPKPTQPVWATPSPPKTTFRVYNASPEHAFAAMERAATAQHRRVLAAARPRPRPDWTKRGRIRRPYTTAAQSREPQSSRLTPEELKPAIDDFLKTLRADSPRDEVRRVKLEREARPPKVVNTSMKKLERRQARRLRNLYPEETERAHAVLRRRLEIEGRRRQNAATRAAEDAWVAEDQWPATNSHAKRRKDFDEPLDASEFAAVFEASEGLTDGETKKKGRSKKNKDTSGNGSHDKENPFSD